MEVRDYNGDGDWSAVSIITRYRLYCADTGVVNPLDLIAPTHTLGSVTWIYPVMDQVIDGIERGDQACIALGIDFIQQDKGFAFGRILKSNTARALRRTPTQLSGQQCERIRERIVQMLVAGNTPREFREYRKLLSRIGVGSWWPYIERGLDRSNKYALRHYELLRRHEHFTAV